MNAKQLSDALGEIDSKYIEEAEDYHRANKFGRLIWTVPAAVCAAVVLAALPALGRISDTDKILPSDSTAATQGVPETAAAVISEAPVTAVPESGDEVRETASRITSAEGSVETREPPRTTAPASGEEIQETVSQTAAATSANETREPPQTTAPVSSEEIQEITSQTTSVTSAKETRKPPQTTTPADGGETIKTSQTAAESDNEEPEPAANKLSMSDIQKRYKEKADITVQETAVVYPWEYLTEIEKYSTVVYNGREYRGGRPVSARYLGSGLGSAEASGFSDEDENEAHRHSISCNIREIKGVSAEEKIAAELDGTYYVFSYDKYREPADLGEILDKYNLKEFLRFERFCDKNEYNRYALSDDGRIWEILEDCRSAPFKAYDSVIFELADKRRVSFTATSEPLGIYKQVFGVYENGYIATNIINSYGYAFFIGEEAAKKIIAYAAENSVSVGFEPYMNSVCGILTEITDGYIVIDDTVLCADPADGMTFRAPAGDMRIKRGLEFEKIGIGDAVRIEFTGIIDADRENLITGVYSFDKGELYEGEMMIAE